MSSRRDIADNNAMRLVGWLMMLAPVCFAGEPQKPVCSARTQGEFWPAEANISQQAAQRLFRSGELELCSLAVWKYKWQHLSVNVRDTGRSRHYSTVERTTMAGRSGGD